MSYNTDLQHRTAVHAIQALDDLGIDTTTATEPMTRWNRVRQAVRNLQKPDAAPLWAAIAADDQKKVTKAATDYMVSQAIKEAALDDTHREDTFRADALSIIKQLVKEALPEARAEYNAAAHDYTEAFKAADGHPDPSELIVTDGGAQIWADLIRAANDMTTAVAVIKLGHEFGIKPNDQGTGLIDQVPYAVNLPDIKAVARAKTTEWVQAKEHAPHRDYAVFLLAGGELYAGTIPEQNAEIERLVEQAQDSRKQKMIPDMMNNDQRALKRAMKAAQKRGDA